MIKPRKIRWTEHEHEGERCEMLTKFCSGNMKEIDHLRHVDVNGKIVLKSIMKKAYVSLWTEFICPRIAIFGGKF
jgi:hypothetical protein